MLYKVTKNLRFPIGFISNFLREVYALLVITNLLCPKHQIKAGELSEFFYKRVCEEIFDRFLFK